MLSGCSKPFLNFESWDSGSEEFGGMLTDLSQKLAKRIAEILFWAIASATFEYPVPAYLHAILLVFSALCLSLF